VTRVYLLVEGQTEEAFVRELLVPHFSRTGMYLSPIIVKTSAGHKGGLFSYAKIKPQLLRLCKQDTQAYVTTLFDLYALPRDFPGRSDADYPTAASGQKKAAFLEARLASDLNVRNFIPYLMTHEFEALLFSEPNEFKLWTDDEAVFHRLSDIARVHATPEDINDNPHTAPSKRILEIMPGYQKTIHGPLIACGIGLDTLRRACPHFHGWLRQLESLGQRS
jgi:hypothetical protein